MRFIFLRHPETVANDVGYIYGKTDYPYTDVGEKQLQSALSISETFAFEKIITSPLARAKRLAEAVARRHNMAVSEASALEEMGYGIFEGLTLEEAEVKFPVALEAFMSGDEQYTIPDGESNEAFNARVAEFLDRCLEEDQDVLLVTHGGVIRTALEYLLDAEPGFSWLLDIGNGSFTEVACGDGHHKILNLRNQSI